MSSVNKKAVDKAGYSFRLFVAGDEPNSVLAKKNLSHICKEHLDGRCNIEIVDVFDDFSTAIENGIIVTPTLVLVHPEPRVKIFGNLNDTEKVVAALHLTGEAQ